LIAFEVLLDAMKNGAFP